MPSCSLFYCRWCYPVVQHLTASAGGGGKGIPSSPGKKKEYGIMEYLELIVARCGRSLA